MANDPLNIYIDTERRTFQQEGGLVLGVTTEVTFTGNYGANPALMIFMQDPDTREYLPIAVTERIGGKAYLKLNGRAAKEAFEGHERIGEKLPFVGFVIDGDGVSVHAENGASAVSASDPAQALATGVVFITYSPVVVDEAQVFVAEGRGLSAYELAVKYGYRGTEEEWSKLYETNEAERQAEFISHETERDSNFRALAAVVTQHPEAWNDVEKAARDISEFNSRVGNGESEIDIADYCCFDNGHCLNTKGGTVSPEVSRTSNWWFSQAVLVRAGDTISITAGGTSDEEVGKQYLIFSSRLFIAVKYGEAPTGLVPEGELVGTETKTVSFTPNEDSYVYLQYHDLVSVRLKTAQSIRESARSTDLAGLSVTSFLPNENNLDGLDVRPYCDFQKTGYYIYNYQGTIKVDQSTNWSVSRPIPLKKGDRIVIRGGGTNASYVQYLLFTSTQLLARQKVAGSFPSDYYSSMRPQGSATKTDIVTVDFTAYEDCYAYCQYAYDTLEYVKLFRGISKVVYDQIVEIEDIKADLNVAEEIDLSRVVPRDGAVNESGNWTSKTTVGVTHGVIKNSGFKSVAITGYSEPSEANKYSSVLFAADEAIWRSGGTIAKASGWSRRVDIPDGVTMEFNVPDDCTFIVFNIKGGSGTVRTPSRFVAQKSSIKEIKSIVDGLDESSKKPIDTDRDVFAYKSQRDYAANFLNAKRVPNSFTFAHITDIHGSWKNVDLFVRFCDAFGEYIDARVNTGDTVKEYYSDGISGYLEVGGVSSIMNLIGNHDTRGTTYWEKSDQAYSTYIAPFISSWGVTAPSGKCYYYKDFGGKLRMIALDIGSFDKAEADWFDSILADARSKNLHVLVASHGVVGYRNKKAKNFGALCRDTWGESYDRYIDRTTADEHGKTKYDYANEAKAQVQQFVDNGGVFVGWLVGHSHHRLLGTVDGYPNQMIFSGDTAAYFGCANSADCDNTDGTESQFAFNVVTVNTDRKTVTCFVVGRELDVNQHRTRSFSVSYETGTVIDDNGCAS